MAFTFEELVPGLTPTTDERYSEEKDRPDIKTWRNQRAADVVRRGLVDANRGLDLRAGDAVIWNDMQVPTDIRVGSRGVLLGFRHRQMLVRFPAASRYPSARELNSHTHPTADWQGFVQPGIVLPARD